MLGLALLLLDTHHLNRPVKADWVSGDHMENNPNHPSRPCLRPKTHESHPRRKELIWPKPEEVLIKAKPALRTRVTSNLPF